jgi:hypothetical protein
MMNHAIFMEGLFFAGLTHWDISVKKKALGRKTITHINETANVKNKGGSQLPGKMGHSS